MVQYSRTKDERFILRLYELATKAGDIQHVANLYEVGKTIGLQERAVYTICTLLAQANFIKKVGKTDGHLTPQGEQLALRLLDEK